MKKSILSCILTGVLALTMVFAFCACKDGDDGSGSGDGNVHTKASTDVESEYETVVYKYTDTSTPEDLYYITITFEHDGDKVMRVTEVTSDDFTGAEDDGIAEMLIEDLNGSLDDTGLKDVDGIECEVDVDGRVRTEVIRYDLSKVDAQFYKDHIGIKSDTDYVSLEEAAAIYEEAGFVKQEKAEDAE